MNFSIILSQSVLGLTFDAVWQAILFILGGLGIFLFGIHMMGSSLKEVAGDRLKVIIQKSTSTPIMGMAIGFLVTMLTQSSSTTSAIAVGLVAAGLMTFKQSIGVLLGANIGGTVLPLLMASLPSYIKPIVAVALVFIGASMIFFFKRKKINQIGSVILGFGLIFLGLALIDMSFDYIQEVHTEYIISIFTKLSEYPELGVVVGVLFTAIVQSSAATIGIVQGLYSVGSISLKGALALMLGANLGTTITAIIASFGSSRTAKKVALANMLIKFFGVIVFVIIFRFAFYPLFDAINDGIFKNELNPLIISFGHIAFNILNSFVILLLIKPFCRLCDKIIDGDEENSIEERLLDYTLINKSVDLALSFVKSSLNYMANVMKEYVHIAKSFALEYDEKLIKEADLKERTINCLDKRIHDYLIKLTISKIDDSKSLLVSKYLDDIKDIERVGDHCTNIFEFFTDRHEKDMHLSEDGVQDLESMLAVLLTMTDGTVEAIETWNGDLANQMKMYEDQIDQLEEVLHERHIHRVNAGYCSFTNTEHYVEILSNIERIGDHLNNILDSIAVKEYSKYDEFNH